MVDLLGLEGNKRSFPPGNKTGVEENNLTLLNSQVLWDCGPLHIHWVFVLEFVYQFVSYLVPRPVCV